MAAANPRRRASANASARKHVKTSLTVSTQLHARWSAAASLRGQDRNAFAAEAIEAACRHIVIIDRTKRPADDSVPDSGEDRPADAA